jgi:hypothetical protein
MLQVASMIDERFVTFQAAFKESVPWAWAFIHYLAIMTFALAGRPVFITSQVWNFTLNTHHYSS